MSSCSKARRDKTGGSLVVLDHKNLHAADLTERRDRATPHGADRLIVDAALRRPNTLSRLLKKSLRFRNKGGRRDFSRPDAAYF
jgi:hypothetical protein